MRTLVDVLTDALARPDGCVVPRIELWEVAMRPSDVQKQPEREFGRGGVVPVILGTRSRRWDRTEPGKALPR